MNQVAFDQIRHLFAANSIGYNLLFHDVCRTSAESAEARAKAGFPSIGAKALVTKLTFGDGRCAFAVLVLPGPSRLDSRALKEQIPELRKFRFVTADELLDLCGVPIGAMPPFGSAIFPKISYLFVDASLRGIETIGFNAADLRHSIVMRSSDYLRVASPSSILSFAV